MEEVFDLWYENPDADPVIRGKRPDQRLDFLKRT